MSNIYQRIWNSDRHKFLVSPRGDDGGWLDPDADILLDEQVGAFGRADLDLARHPLFYRVNQDKLHSIATYQSLIALLDNYRFDNQKSEIVTRAEKAENEQFIDDICQTEVMEIARTYLEQQLQVDFSAATFAAQLQSIWFDLYTNYFGDLPTRDSSAFEHIFVGEGKYDYSAIADRKIHGGISGYHSWIKFHLDEQQQKANYLGHNYSIEGDLGVDNPYVVTVQMQWRDREKHQNIPIELFKKRGCFFVGTSPECEIAMGTVAYFESLANYKFRQEKRAISINGANYNLALYRNTKLDASRGKRIRSFYPIYLGVDSQS
ncbi:MAG: endoribonuclease [Cyanobacteria bacterium J06621_12]